MTARAPTVNCFILEKGSTPVTSPGFIENHDSFAAEFAARLQLSLEDDEHRVRGSPWRK